MSLAEMINMALINKWPTADVKTEGAGNQREERQEAQRPAVEHLQSLLKTLAFFLSVTTH